MVGRRTHLANDVREKTLGKTVTVMGWVLRRRDHGGVIFVDLRDRSGLVQLVFNPEHSLESHARAHLLRPEWVLAVSGLVRHRPDDSVNPDLPTGMIEIFVDQLKILNRSDSPPFPLDEDVPPTDAVRYRYRYLDLRREGGARDILMHRHKVMSVMREFLNKEDFTDIETPFPDGQHSRRRPGLPGAQPPSPGKLLCAAAVAADLQATAHGCRF